MFNLYKLLVAILVMTALMTALYPFIASPLTTAEANVLNQSAYNESQTFNMSVYSPINSSLFHKTNGNYTGGFFAQVTLFTGLAFVIDNIGYIMLAILNIPSMFITYMSLSMASLPLALAPQHLLQTLVYEFIGFILLILGISAWMKYNMKEG